MGIHGFADAFLAERSLDWRCRDTSRLPGCCGAGRWHDRRREEHQSVVRRGRDPMAAAGEAAIWPQAASARTGSDWSCTWGIAHMAANPPRERLGWLDEPNYSPRTPCFQCSEGGGNGVESLENRIASSSSVPVIITACVNLSTHVPPPLSQRNSWAERRTWRMQKSSSSPKAAWPGGWASLEPRADLG
ncbi:hypothetical protein ACCO45_002410 [Purpureocillium lilacinum]|uniref:Uncharacterized protein n=1 Tax=Purpureocillium lilacinum TaxID=33203 RepID=A0ACC4EAB9_PURLI